VTETNVFRLSQPGTCADPLAEVLRNGARALLAQAVEAEVAALLISYSLHHRSMRDQQVYVQEHLNSAPASRTDPHTQTTVI
jgi:putative transposase